MLLYYIYTIYIYAFYRVWQYIRKVSCNSFINQSIEMMYIKHKNLTISETGRSAYLNLERAPYMYILYILYINISEGLG